MDYEKIAIIILIILGGSMGALWLLESHSLQERESHLSTCQSDLLRQESTSRDLNSQYRTCEESLFNCKHGVK